MLIASTEGVISPEVEGSSQSSELSTPTPRLRRVLSSQPSATSMLLGHSSTRFDKLPVGSLIEVSPTSFRIAHQIGRLLATQPPPSDVLTSAMDESEKRESNEGGVGGCGLIVDYGAAQVFGDSFRVCCPVLFFKNALLIVELVGLQAARYRRPLLSSRRV